MHSLGNPRGSTEMKKCENQEGIWALEILLNKNAFANYFGAFFVYKNFISNIC